MRNGGETHQHSWDSLHPPAICVTAQALVRQGGDMNKRLVATTKALVRQWGGRKMKNGGVTHQHSWDSLHLPAIVVTARALVRQGGDLTRG